MNDQRYNDSVNDFAEFLRNVYNEVGNTANLKQGESGTTRREKCTIWASSPGSDRKLNGTVGRSDCALYGKMILFNWDNAGTPYIYDLVGDAVDLYYNPVEDSSNALDALEKVGAGILAKSCVAASSSGSCSYALGYAGSEIKYTTPWQHRIENTNRDTNNLASYTLVIARAPTDNTVHTFVLGKNATQILANTRGASHRGGISSSDSSNSSSLRVLASRYSEIPDEGLNFCIDQDTGGDSNDRRRNVRINANASSADAVEIVQMDSTAAGGNACL